MLTKNTQVTLTIEDIANDGNGVGRYKGMAVFVPFSALGDQLLVHITKAQKNFAYAKIVSILSPGDGRTQNNCPAFGKCGGCCFRHLDYSAECTAKQKFVADAIRRIGGFERAPVFEITPSPVTEQYRNKVIFPVQQLNGKLQPGLYAARSHRIISETTACFLQPNIMNQIATISCRLLGELGASAYDEHTGRGLLRHIMIRQNKNGATLLCIIINGDKLPAEQTFCDQIAAQYPQVETIVVNTNTERNNVILGTQNRTLYGLGRIADQICGISVSLSPNSFFQVNNAAATLLYRKIQDVLSLACGETLLDLYCGVGTIGFSLADKKSRLIGVESVEQAVADARNNAAQLGFTNTEFICANAKQAAAEIAAREIHIDAIVTDPPRKGCEPQTLEAILAMAPKRIAMVSCNPATLARDLKILCDSGYYSLTGVYPFDLFPRTNHVECVALVSKKARTEE